MRIMLTKLLILLVLVLSFFKNFHCKDEQDYYELLGVERTAKLGEIKKAFHTLGAKYHPDKDQSPDAGEKFKMISEAYAVLKDHEKRKQYDIYGALYSYEKKRQNVNIRLVMLWDLIHFLCGYLTVKLIISLYLCIRNFINGNNNPRPPRNPNLNNGRPPRNPNFNDRRRG